MSFWNFRPVFAPRMIAAAAIALTAVATAAPAEAGARGRAPWCGNLSGHSLDDCNYFTYEQCWVSVRGLGGFCARNPGALAYAPGEPRRKKYRRNTR
jgi:hypothetical protein